MDKQQLLGYFQDHYLSRQDVLFKLPLNISIESFWQDLVNQRKARATMLPLYSATGQPYWFVTTDKMVKASERLCEEAMKHDSFFDPYRIPLSQALTSALSQEAYFTSFVEGADYPIQAAVDFLRRGSEPENAYEQNILNNYQAGSYLLSALSIPFDETFVKELAATLSEGQDGFRTTDTPAIPAMEGEPFKVPPAHMLADRMGQFYAFLADVRVHPLIKGAVGQAYILVTRPFQEANERLGRLISNAVLLRYGYDFFLDISISAYIARESYRYFKAMREIIRSDNEGDMTYFVEYYLELLVRALDGTRMEEAERLQSQLESERKMALQPLKQPTVQYTQPHNYSAEAVARVIDSAESEQETAHGLQEERSAAPDPPTLPDGDASYRSSQSQAGSTQGDSENAALQAASQGRPCPPLLGLTDELLDKIGKMLDTEISPFNSNQWAQTMGCSSVEGRNECRELFLLGLADRVPRNNVFLYTFKFSKADYTTAYREISAGRIIEPVTQKQWNHALSILEQAGIEYIDKTVAFIRECVEMGRTTFFLTDLCQYGSVQDKHCSVALQTLVDRGIIVLPAKKNKKHRIVMPSPKNSRKHSEGELLQAVVASQEPIIPDALEEKLAQLACSSSAADRRIAKYFPQFIREGRTKVTFTDWMEATKMSDSASVADLSILESLGMAKRIYRADGKSPFVYELILNPDSSVNWENLSLTTRKVLDGIVRAFGASAFTLQMLEPVTGMSAKNMICYMKALKLRSIVTTENKNQREKLYSLAVPVEEAVEHLREFGFDYIALVG